MPKSKSKWFRVGEVRGYLEAGWLRVPNKPQLPRTPPKPLRLGAAMAGLS
jgi:hypothetical protein